MHSYSRAAAPPGPASRPANCYCKLAARNPAFYTVSSLAGVLHALHLAGVWCSAPMEGAMGPLPSRCDAPSPARMLPMTPSLIEEGEGLLAYLHAIDVRCSDCAACEAPYKNQGQRDIAFRGEDPPSLQTPTHPRPHGALARPSLRCAFQGQVPRSRLVASVSGECSHAFREG